MANADPAKYWPGGIPSHIRCHDEALLGHTFREEIKGWHLFLEKETAAPDTSKQDPNYNVTQRRGLVSQWASMSQAERDSYQDRAPLREHGGWYPPKGGLEPKDEDYKQSRLVNLIVEQPLSPRNHALWTKIRVLLHHFEGPWDGNLFADDDHGTAIIQPNPAGPNPLTPEAWLSWEHVETALFGGMAMTSKGTVVFEQTGGALLLADQEALDSGRLLLCDLGSDGRVDASARVWPMLVEEIHNFIMGKAWTASRLIFERDWRDDGDEYDQRLTNMEQPVLDFLEAHAEWMDGGDRGREEWRKDIEIFAPGYLEMEEAGNGLATDYDHSNFTSADE